MEIPFLFPNIPKSSEIIPLFIVNYQVVPQKFSGSAWKKSGMPSPWVELYLILFQISNLSGSSKIGFKLCLIRRLLLEWRMMGKKNYPILQWKPSQARKKGIFNQHYKLYGNNFHNLTWWKEFVFAGWK